MQDFISDFAGSGVSCKAAEQPAVIARHNLYIFRFAVFCIFTAMKTAGQSANAVAAVWGGNASACSTVFKIAVFLTANDDARPCILAYVSVMSATASQSTISAWDPPAIPPDQKSAFYRIFTAEGNPLYIRAEICKADYSAGIIPALYAYIFHFQVFHP